jgi:hypothetical protein
VVNPFFLSFFLYFLPFLSCFVVVVFTGDYSFFVSFFFPVFLWTNLYIFVAWHFHSFLDARDFFFDASSSSFCLFFDFIIPLFSFLL